MIVCRTHDQPTVAGITDWSDLATRPQIEKLARRVTEIMASFGGASRSAGHRQPAVAIILVKGARPA